MRRFQNFHSHERLPRVVIVAVSLMRPAWHDESSSETACIRCPLGPTRSADGTGDGAEDDDGLGLAAAACAAAAAVEAGGNRDSGDAEITMSEAPESQTRGMGSSSMQPLNSTSAMDQVAVVVVPSRPEGAATGSENAAASRRQVRGSSAAPGF